MSTVQQLPSACPSSCEASGIRRQFAKPTGMVGGLIGHLMAYKNRDRSEWVLDLLQIQPQDRILELGFGSGADIQRMSRLAHQGAIAGIDHSVAMVQQARWRNRVAIATGQVDLRLGIATELPFAAGMFDKCISINVAQFWPEPGRVLTEIKRVLKSGGTVAIAIQPRIPQATEATTQATGQYLVEILSADGLTDLRIETKPLKPVSAVCVLGRTT